MKIRVRSFSLLLLPVFFMLGPKNISSAVAAASTPTPQIKPGDYLGTINLTIMHQASISVEGMSRTWYIEAINTTGNIDITAFPNGWSMAVDIPIPITAQDRATIDTEGSECKGWTLNGSGYGTAIGNMPPRLVPFTGDSFEISSIEFTLSSIHIKIQRNGKCDIGSAAPELEEAVRKDFVAIFSSTWYFYLRRTGTGSISGTCKSETFGMHEGEKLECSWRAFFIPP